VSGPFSGTANRPIGILKTADQGIGRPELLPMANQEIGGPGEQGSATASGLLPSDLRVGGGNSDFQPGAAGLHFLRRGLRKGDILIILIHHGDLGAAFGRNRKTL
jgi:hypothetical protein